MKASNFIGGSEYCIRETSTLSIVSWITVTYTICYLPWVLYLTIHTGALTTVKYFATFVVNSLSSFKNSNAHDLYGFRTTYFAWNINDQDKNWNHIHCSTCAVDLRAWLIGKVHEHHLPYLQPGKKSEYHISGCYFCLADISGYM
jgi:hypothetical protein